ncbi:MAG: energy-dependent translational throttle protein EttA [Acidobacteriota bacterium]|nr:energy-dependent translational throttle protein EttA [Acidobacteriota bacterium]
MSYQYIYTMKGLNKIYPPSAQVLKNIWLSFFPGAKIGVLGLNGSGKSTLLKIMAGLDNDFQGEAWPAEGVKIGFLPQEPQLTPDKTVAENVQEGVGEVMDLLTRFDQINDAFATADPDEMEKLLDEQARIQDQIEQRNAWDIQSKLDMAMDALRCPPGDWPVTNLSGGEKRRVALCKLLLQEPDLLLLDEPTNHLDAETVGWLERYLHKYEGTIVAITHDRYFLDNVAGWILELDRGEGIPYEGNYSGWLEQKEKRLAQEAKEMDNRRKVLQTELEWIRMSAKARHKKSKARISAYEELASQSEKEKRIEGAIVIPSGPRLGDLVLEADNLTKSYGEKLLFENLSFRLPKGGIVGVIGPNGAGKSTLFRIITGNEQPDAGSLRIGPTVKVSYVDQSRDGLDPDASVWEAISDGEDIITLGNRQMNSRAYVGSFNLRGSEQQKKVGSLSGGERNRVHLAVTVKENGNLLLLDEPTNDLDVETLRSLEDALLNFAGCAVVISHDRWFLDRIATHILAFEGNSEVVWFEGNYEDYEKDRKKRLGDEADQPHRIKYRKFTRS